jgi:hypothetical protein
VSAAAGLLRVFRLTGDGSGVSAGPVWAAVYGRKPGVSAGLGGAAVYGRKPALFSSPAGVLQQRDENRGAR